MVTYYTAERVYCSGKFINRAYLGVENGEIISISFGEPPGGSRIVDFGALAIFPSAVNTHTHSFQSVLRGRVDDVGLSEWLRIVYSASANFDVEASYLSGAMSFGEMLRSGTTTVADFFYLNGRGNDNARGVIQAAKDLGIRIVMARTFLDAEWGGEATRETVETAVKRFQELRAEFKDNPMVRVHPAPHSLYGASREMIRVAHELAKEHKTLWHMHLADSERSAKGVLEKFGKSSAILLNEWGVLSSRLIAVHGMWLSEEEIHLLAQNYCRISYNPASNMILGEKILDLQKFYGRGIPVGLGTDGAASNNALNMFRDVHLASLSQKLNARNPQAITVDQLVRLMTEDGAKILDVPVGVLDVGRRADFVVLDVLDFSLQPVATLKSNIVHALSDRAIKHVYCDGREVVKDGHLSLVDERELLQKIAKFASKIST
jgi:5-methylthioadenosine/S-adenosylhomocysteine deaminase